LSQIEKQALCRISLIEIIIPSSVEALSLGCFSECKSLFSIIFESASRFLRIEKWAFCGTDLIEIILAHRSKSWAKVLSRLPITQFDYIWIWVATAGKEKGDRNREFCGRS
jgi:hypothetical protein